MKNRIIILACIFIFSSCQQEKVKNQNQTEQTPNINNSQLNNDSILNEETDSIKIPYPKFGIDSTFLDPQFPGGEDSLTNFIKKELKMPDKVRLLNINNTLCVTIEINKKGKIVGKKILMEIPLCSECQEEAFRIIDKMPNWEPACEKNKDGSIKEISEGNTVVCFDFK